MTSSGSSETDSARQRAAGASTASRRRISTPPPPGRWTSSSTTSGARATISRTAPSTSPASPTICTRPSSSARTPARNSAWSSTSTTVGRAPPRASASVPVIQHQLHLPARFGRAVPGGAAAAAGHPAHDRLADAAPVLGHGVGIEAAPAVADEDLGAPVGDLDEQRDGLGAAAVAHGVGQRLAGGRDERAVAVVEVAVADGDDLDRDAVGLLDLGGGGARGVGQPLVGTGLGRARQPRAQLALLAARERGDRARVVGLLLDERE